MTDETMNSTGSVSLMVEWLETVLNMEMLTESIKYTMERNLPCFYIIL